MGSEIIPKQGSTIKLCDARPSHASPKAGKRVWFIESRANDYPAQVRGPGSGLASLHDPYRHDRQRLIPDCVTNIGYYAFYLCHCLAAVYSLGNAPTVHAPVFPFDSNAIVYCLPGTCGWDKWVSPPPALLLNPEVQTSDASFGVWTNQFGFNVTGTSNLAVVVEASTNLTNSATCKAKLGVVFIGNCRQWIVKDNIIRDCTESPIVCSSKNWHIVKDNILE